MIFPKPKNEKERIQYQRQSYDKKDLNAFLFNSLKDNYESELKEDGIF